MREAVRSGRRANFFITENRFIDCYAAKVGGSGIAVYSILQRCANSDTKETWISAHKMAQVLDMDKSTVYRQLKQLEDLRLIKSMRTREKTIYVVLPVPPPPAEIGPTPLFDALEFKTDHQESIWPPVAQTQMSPTCESDSHRCNQSVAPVQQTVSPVQPVSRTGKNRNKEEQDLINKTQEQDFRGNKTLEQQPPEINEAAERILEILGLPTTLITTAAAAVRAEIRQTGMSIDGVATRIATAANLARRRGVASDKFLEDFVAQAFAQQVIENLNLPATSSLISIVTAAVKAEGKYTGQSLEKVADSITRAALEDRQRGTPIDKFYFEDTKWRIANGGRNKAEQQFDRISRARERAIENIKARSHS